MNVDGWKQIDGLLDAVLEIAPPDRTDFLVDKCVGGEKLRRRVTELLASMDKAEDFLESSPVESVFGLLGEEPTEDLVGRQIGVYRLIRLIGQGGMGSVFLASRIDREFRKEVAIKVVSSLWRAAEIKDNFRRERQILARLEHENIARLLDGGTTDEGIPFLVMEYVEGLPVTEYCEQKKLSVTEKLLLFLKICEAVKFAHQHLIIHRDLKPSNILITEDGTPKLLDFGVAKLLNPALVDITENFTIGTNMLTPGYASPEQLKNESITTASDVYSLGVLLYELFTGKRPHDLKGKSLPEILQIITEESPALPSKALAPSKTAARNSKTKDPRLNPQRIKGDIDTIILRSLAKEPGERYQTVEALCGDINRHLTNLPITARKPSAAYRFRKFAQRHKYGMAAAIMIFLLLSGWLASAIYVARTARVQARENLRRAYSADMNLAMQAYETSNLTRLNEILTRYEDTDFKQNWEYRFLQNLIDPKGKLLTVLHSGEVWNIAFSPDGKKLATACADGFARIYEVPSGKLLAITATQEKNVWRVKFSPDGRFLATASGDMKSTSAKIWDAETGAEVFSLTGHTARVRGIDFSPDGKLIATGSRDGTIRIWNAENGKELKKCTSERKGQPLETNDLQFTPDGKKLLVGNNDGAEVRESSSGKVIFNLHEKTWAFSVAVSPDGKLFAHGGSDFAIYIYDTGTGKPISRIAAHEAQINQVSFSLDGKLIASASSDRTVRFFNVESGAETQNLKAHLNQSWSIALSPDGKFIATSATDFAAFLWNAAEVMKASSFDFSITHNGGGSPISADRTKAAVARRVSENLYEQIIWDVSEKKRIVNFSSETDIQARAFSPDGAILATGNRNGEIAFWNSASGAQIRRFKAHDNRVSGLAFSPDGKRMVSGSYDETVRIWNTEEASPIRELCRFESLVITLGISPDGSMVFAATLDTTAKLFNFETGETIADFGKRRKPISSVAFAPGGKSLVIGDADGIIEIRQTSDGKLLETLTGNAGTVQALTYTPDASRLASASAEGMIRLWDTETKEQVLAIRTGSAITSFLAFTPDGNTLISLGIMEKLKFWEAAPRGNPPAEK